MANVTNEANTANMAASSNVAAGNAVDAINHRDNHSNKRNNEQNNNGARMAYEGKGEQKAGDWCKFCRAKPVCKALAEEALALCREEFLDLDAEDSTEALYLSCYSLTTITGVNV